MWQLSLTTSQGHKKQGLAQYIYDNTAILIFSCPETNTYSGSLHELSHLQFATSLWSTEIPQNNVAKNPKYEKEQK